MADSRKEAHDACSCFIRLSEQGAEAWCHPLCPCFKGQSDRFNRHNECRWSGHVAIDKALEAALRGTPEERITKIVIENDIRKEERTRIIKLLRLWVTRKLSYPSPKYASLMALADEIEGKDENPKPRG